MAVKPKRINLALQGGGSHGAFTWGVLDRILEDDRISIEAVTGASAGAINAVILAHGVATCGTATGHDGARKALRAFWTRIGELGDLSLFRRSPLDVMRGGWGLDASPIFSWYEMLSRLVSPYDLNPLNINPVRGILDEVVDFEAIRGCGKLKLFISATNVRTGRVKVFSQARMSVERVMASTCLPLVFQAVEVDGEYYWDGGYMGNPPLWPLFYSSVSRDLVIVEINPLERPEVPRTAHDILNRLNEITFNSALVNELRMIDFVGRLVDQGAIDGDRYRKFLVHMIRGGDKLSVLGAATKMNAERDFLLYLHELGRQSADQWLADHFDALGHSPTIDIGRVAHAPRPLAGPAPLQAAAE